MYMYIRSENTTLNLNVSNRVLQREYTTVNPLGRLLTFFLPAEQFLS